MASRPPSKRMPPAAPHRLRQVSPQLPSTPLPSTSDSLKPSASTFISRKTGVKAIGVAVIVIAGTILGSQLKTRKQAYDKTEAQLSIEATGLGTRERPVPSRSSSQGTSTVKSSPAEVQKQIALLEERRSSLVLQKYDYEKKLEGLHERKRRMEEMEARRPQASNEQR